MELFGVCCNAHFRRTYRTNFITDGRPNDYEALRRNQRFSNIFAYLIDLSGSGIENFTKLQVTLEELLSEITQEIKLMQ